MEKNHGGGGGWGPGKTMHPKTLVISPKSDSTQASTKTIFPFILLSLAKIQYLPKSLWCLFLQKLPPKSYPLYRGEGMPPRRREENESGGDLFLSPSQRSLFCILMRTRLGQVR